MKCRRGETPKTYFRTDRFYTIGNGWYVATREGNDIGPFITRAAAAQSVSKYVAGINGRQNSRVQATSLSRDVWANTNCI